tara:strand:- start:1156 stop:1305 length:150 start_codon:yes stop_codon:yes gene_type:complete
MGRTFGSKTSLILLNSDLLLEPVLGTKGCDSDASQSDILGYSLRRRVLE